MAATEPIRNQQDIRALEDYYRQKNQYRNHLLVVMGLHTALRISDCLSLRWETVYDFQRSRVYRQIHLIEHKTEKSKTIALHQELIAALTHFAIQAACPGGYLFENPRTKQPISRIQAYRIIKGAAQELDIGRVSCHSLRKTFGYHAWKGGASPTVIMEIYNHNSLAVTRRYLGVTQDDKNEIYLNLHFDK